MQFSKLPHKDRFAKREALEKIGCHIAGYYGDGVTVALPRGKAGEAYQTAKNIGLYHKESHYMSLCSDNPPDHLRHIGPYQKHGDRPAYWLYAHFELSP